MLPRASRTLALALARRASASASSAEPIACAASAASGGACSPALAPPPLVVTTTNLWQARALATTTTTAAAAAAASSSSSSSPLLRAWRSSAQQHQHPRRRSFASGADKEDGEGGGKDKEDAAAAAAAEAGDGSSSGEDAADPLLLAAKEKELEEAKQRERALTERLQYALAEAENVRQRARRELETKSQFAVADLAKQLLDVADNLWRAEEAVPKPVRDALFGEGGEGGGGSEDGAAAAQLLLEGPKATALLKSLLEGLRATDRGLHELLRKQGIERYDPTGEPFDPNLHAAMFQVPDATKTPGTVAALHRRGYMIRDRVLRAAEVGVAREP